jgi:hypothetical protein
LVDMAQLENEGLIACNHLEFRHADLKLTSLDHFQTRVERVQGIS